MENIYDIVIVGPSRSHRVSMTNMAPSSAARGINGL